ncbi:heavy metal translocating P-type ATPase [Mariniplasma anaerobium]|uniref:Cadmium transporter n=1 Tax=Mariniplasma anaerobium TaxID=2735436 RepID=A0A7U9TIR7_9MOLU|nr:heavy metal translocating P-type ATPase [Mariniplasma anaerobium]BCR35485.1 cadmium transporter [Mariniplasma anaerobium]
MKKTYEIRDIDCANCALKIENEIKKVDGLKDVKIDFMRQKVFFDDPDNKMNADELQKIARKVESSVSIFNSNIEKPISKKSMSLNQMSFITGVVLLLVMFLLQAIIGLNDTYKIIIYITAYILIGGKVILKALKNIKKGRVFDENFLMMIATIGALIIGEFIEGIAVMLFYQIGEYFQELSVNRSRKHIESLMDLKPVIAHIKKDDQFIDIKPEDLIPKDHIMVKTGEKIPVDGIIIEGETYIDESSLTGESLPMYKSNGHEVMSSTINLNGTIIVEVKKTYKDSRVYQIIEFVEQNTTKKAKAEQFITKFAKYYTPIVVLIAVLLAFVVPIFAYQINQTTYSTELTIFVKRALIFLVISCPCALVLSVPLAFYAGIGASSKKGILVKSGSDLETLHKVEHFIFDKTGTLTKGEFVVTQVFAEDKDFILKLASHAESRSNHPIALSILRAYKKDIISEDIKDYHEVFGQGIKVVYQQKPLLVGNDRLLINNKIQFEIPDIKYSVIHVAYDQKYIGYIVLEDELKMSSKETIALLTKMGKQVTMITGDQSAIADDIGKKLGITDIYSKQLPQDKKDIVESLSKQHKTAFIGDGINDAMVLLSADIGISMGSLGSDVAIEASDAVIMHDQPIKLIEVLKISIFTNRIVIQNIALALITKFVVLSLGALGYANMWLAIFADVGISLIAVLNAMRILRK